MLIDRRLNSGNKSLENRQRFLRRAKVAVQKAVADAISNRDIADIASGGNISIPVDGMNEPTFHKNEKGIRDLVFPGNKEYIAGDVVPRPEGGSGRGPGGGSGNDPLEDAFRFNLTRDEFVSLFLDDLELPDMTKRQVIDIEKTAVRRAGYSVSGSPPNMSILRTMRLSLARRIAMHRPRDVDVAKLEAALTAAIESQDLVETARLRDELAALQVKMLRVPYIDPVDVRYRRFETYPKPSTRAVIFALMDVSGSMSEHKKDLAKRFYMLLYLFLTRKYQRVEIVFIRHTTDAQEVDEHTFFYSQESGGTIVSSALLEMLKIVKERYNPDDWNIYACQASDGDNFSSDNVAITEVLPKILAITQYFAYLEVDESATEKSDLWKLYLEIDKSHLIAQRKVSSRFEIFPIFQDLFRKRRVEEAA